LPSDLTSARWRRLLGWALIATVAGYAVALLLIIVGFRWIGERWWITTAGMYLPQIVFAAPWPFLTIALAIWGPRRLLVIQAVTAWMLLFPVMGLQLAWPARHTKTATSFRVLTYNINWAHRGDDVLLRQIQAANADVVLLQETGDDQRRFFRANLTGYHFHTSSEFLLATRFPIRDTFKPPQLTEQDLQLPPRFIRYTLETPRGLIDVYNVHPVSPREGLQGLRGDGLRHEVTSGRLFAGRAAPRVAANSALRLKHVRSIADHASGSSRPVVIAGDTNLPHPSWALRTSLGGYQDGFVEAGNGFGYTFPAPRPWVRIDRILAGPAFRFLSLSVSPVRGSDHLCVIADLDWR
jgi:vancomycin resistance protein VanJ